MPLGMKILRVTACRRDFDETKYMSFLMKYNELLGKYNEIYSAILLRKDLIMSPCTMKNMY